MDIDQVDLFSGPHPVLWVGAEGEWRGLPNPTYPPVVRGIAHAHEGRAWWALDTQIGRCDLYGRDRATARLRLLEEIPRRDGEPLHLAAGRDLARRLQGDAQRLQLYARCHAPGRIEAPGAVVGLRRWLAPLPAVTISVAQVATSTWQGRHWQGGPEWSAAAWRADLRAAEPALELLREPRGDGAGVRLWGGVEVQP